MTMLGWAVEIGRLPPILDADPVLLTTDPTAPVDSARMTAAQSPVIIASAVIMNCETRPFSSATG